MPETLLVGAWCTADNRPVSFVVFSSQFLFHRLKCQDLTARENQLKLEPKTLELSGLDNRFCELDKQKRVSQLVGFSSSVASKNTKF